MELQGSEFCLPYSENTTPIAIVATQRRNDRAQCLVGIKTLSERFAGRIGTAAQAAKNEYEGSVTATMTTSSATAPLSTTTASPMGSRTNELILPK